MRTITTIWLMLSAWVSYAEDHLVLKNFTKVESKLITNPSNFSNSDFMESAFTQDFIARLNEINAAEMEIICDSLINGKACFAEVYQLDIIDMNENFKCVVMVGDLIEPQPHSYVGRKLILLKRDNQVYKIDKLKKEKLSWHDFGMKVIRRNETSDVFYNKCSDLLNQA